MGFLVHMRWKFRSFKIIRVCMTLYPYQLPVSRSMILLRFLPIRRRHRVAAASSGRRVAPPWPRRIWLVSTRGRNRSTVDTELVCPASARTTRTTSPIPAKWTSGSYIGKLGNMASCPGVPWLSRAMWPNTDKRRLLMKSIIPSANTFPNISFAMGWEVPLVSRNTISHGGTVSYTHLTLPTNREV